MKHRTHTASLICLYLATQSLCATAQPSPLQNLAGGAQAAQTPPEPAPDFRRRLPGSSELSPQPAPPTSAALSGSSPDPGGPAAVPQEPSPKPDQLSTPTLVNPPVLPPALPDRPPLLPPDSTASPLLSPAARPPRRPAAWRASADRLFWQTKSPSSSNSNICQSRKFSVSYDEALMSLMSALAEAGYSVETLNSGAGQLLAREKDASSPIRLIFSIAELPPQTTTISVMPEGQPKLCKTKAMQTVLLLTEAILNKRGSI